MKEYIVMISEINFREIKEKYNLESTDSFSAFWYNNDCSKYIRVFKNKCKTNDPDNIRIKKMIKDNILSDNNIKQLSLF